MLPLLVTVYLVRLMFLLIDRTMGGWITQLLVATGFATRQEGLIRFLGISFHERVPIVGVLMLLLLLLLAGCLAKTPAGRYLFRGIGQLAGKIPLVRGIYSTVQQVSQSFLGDRSSFKQVVLVEYPSKGIYTVGFLTGDSQGDILSFTGREYINVFLPKSPNPTNGWLALVPRDEVTFLNIPVEEGLTFVISGGVVPPHTFSPPLVEKQEK